MCSVVLPSDERAVTYAACIHEYRNIIRSRESVSVCVVVGGAVPVTRAVRVCIEVLLRLLLKLCIPTFSTSERRNDFENAWHNECYLPTFGRRLELLGMLDGTLTHSVLVGKVGGGHCLVSSPPPPSMTTVYVCVGGWGGHRLGPCVAGSPLCKTRLLSLCLAWTCLTVKATARSAS